MFATSSGSSSPAQTIHKTARQLASSSAPSDDPSTAKSVGSLAKSSSKSSSSKEQTLGEGLNEDDVLRDSIANMVMNDRDQEEDAPSIVNIPESECFLTSVLELRQQIQDDKHSRTCPLELTMSPLCLICLGLTDILRNSKFVGMVDVTSTRSLFQHELKLYLVNHSAVA
jgi:hypothetical protein